MAVLAQGECDGPDAQLFYSTLGVADASSFQPAGATQEGEQTATKAWVVTYETEGTEEDADNREQVREPMSRMLHHVLSALP
jgi:hypothetical protein